MSWLGFLSWTSCGTILSFTQGIYPTKIKLFTSADVFLSTSPAAPKAALKFTKEILEYQLLHLVLTE